MTMRRALVYASVGVLFAIAVLVGSVLLPRALPPAASSPNGLPVISSSPAVVEPAIPPTSSPTPEIETPPLSLDPVVCAQRVTPAPQGVSLPYPASGVIGGGEVQNGDFTFNIRLYCDERLRPDDPEHFSDLAGLGVYSRWTYRGPKIEGEFWDMFGVAPDVRMATGSPMLYNSGASMGEGLRLPDEPGGAWQIAELVRNEEPIRFVVKVQSIDGVYGAELSFKLEAGENGYIPYDIAVRSLPVESLAGQPEIETPEEQKLPPVEAPNAPDPAANGLIAFSSGGENQAEIYTVQPDGNGLTNLTDHPANDSYPIWSPDGGQIAFLSDRRGEGVMDVYVMNSDGSQPRLVYALPTQSPNPEVGEAGETPTIFWLSWSPDGQYILAEARLADLSQGVMAEKCLVIARVAGEAGMCVTNLDFTAPQWSPDGKYIAYVKPGRNFGIARLDVNALFSEDIHLEQWIYSDPGWRAEGQAQWSPDSQWVAGILVNDATREAALRVSPVSGGDGNVLAALGSAYRTRESHVSPVDVLPAWSPDGEWLAFGGAEGLRVIRPDGSDVTDLLDVKLLRSVTWSPDGRTILFSAGEESQAYLLDFAAALADPGQAQAMPLAVDPDLYPWFFAWQPVLP